MAESNRELLDRLMQAFGVWDEPTLRKIIADDVTYHVPGKSAISGDHRGWDGYYAYCEKIGDLSAKTADYRLHDIMASDDHGVALMRVLADRDGRHLDVNVAWVAHLKDGRVVEVWEVPVDQAAWDAFWS